MYLLNRVYLATLLLALSVTVQMSVAAFSVVSRWSSPHVAPPGRAESWHCQLPHADHGDFCITVTKDIAVSQQQAEGG